MYSLNALGEGPGGTDKPSWEQGVRACSACIHAKNVLRARPFAWEDT